VSLDAKLYVTNSNVKRFLLKLAYESASRENSQRISDFRHNNIPTTAEPQMKTQIKEIVSKEIYASIIVSVRMNGSSIKTMSEALR